MAKLTDNTWVTANDGTPRLLEVGDKVPTWAADQVGRHLLDDDDTEPTPYRDQKMSDLRDEIDRRNVGRASADKINPEGHASIESYAAALEADDDESSDGDGDGSGDQSGQQRAPAGGAPAPAAPAAAPENTGSGDAPAARSRRSR